MSALAEFLLLIFIVLPYTFLWSIIHFCFPLKKKQFNGEVVLITGGGHGVGRCLAIKLSDQKAKVIIWDIDKTNGEATCKEIQARGGFAKSYVCDVTDVEAVKQTVHLVRTQVGEVTVLINNAGIFNCLSVLDLSVEQIQRCVSINLTSHFWTVKEFLPHMLQWNRGHIVAISSIAGIFGSSNATDYAATKFGVRGMMESLEHEVVSRGKLGVKLSTVYPVFIDTGMAKNPVIRFPSLTKIFTPDEAADEILAGMMKDERNIYIPKWPLLLGHVVKGCLPYRCVRLLTDFIGMKAEPHNQQWHEGGHKE